MTENNWFVLGQSNPERSEELYNRVVKKLYSKKTSKKEIIKFVYGKMDSNAKTFFILDGYTEEESVMLYLRKGSNKHLLQIQDYLDSRRPRQIPFQLNVEMFDRLHRSKK